MPSSSVSRLQITKHRVSTGETSKRLLSIAKITHPKTTGVFPRKRLFRLLDEYRGSPVVWISAPGGSGKTTLVASYLAEKKLSSVWYRVDEGDSDIATFFYYMGLAAKKGTAASRKPLPLLTPEYLLGIKTFTLRYFEDLFGRMKPPSVIVLDNYHHVPLQSEFHGIISTGLDIIPEGITVIIISREAPPPMYARLRVNGKISLLVDDDISFNHAEAKELVRTKGGRKLSLDTIEHIYERTRGWAAGLVLMAENTEGDEITKDNIAGCAPQEIFDYFATEIFDKLDLERQQFLLKSSFLPWLSVGIAEKLTCSLRAEEVLSSLHRNNFFTERDSGAKPAYRYHPLFREFLLSKAKLTLSQEEIIKIQLTAASLYMECGLPDEAAALFVEAGDWQGFVPFLLAQAPALQAQGRMLTLAGWIERIPADITENTPWLLYWLGLSKFGFNLDECRSYLEKAFDLFDAQGDDPGALRAWAAVVEAVIYDFDDLRPYDRWIEWLDRRIKQEPSLPSPDIEAAVSSSMIVALEWRRPTHPEIKSWINRALVSLRENPDVGLRLLACKYVSNYFNWMGDHAECRFVLDNLQTIADSRQAPPIVVLAFKVIEAHYYAWLGDDSDRALRCIEEGFSLAEETGIRIMDSFLATQGVLCALNKGDVRLLEEFVNRMGADLQPGRCYHGFYYGFKATLDLLKANYPDALNFGEKMLAIFEAAGLPFPQAWARIGIAQAAHVLGDLARADVEIDKARSFCLEVESRYFTFTCDLVKAYFAFSRGDDVYGLDLLGKALRLGRDRGFSNAPLLHRPAVWSLLCAKALEAGIDVVYIQSLIRKRGLVADSTVAYLESWPWPVKIYTLDRFEIFIEGKQLEFGSKAPRRVISLLKLLVAYGEGGASEEQIADILWPDSDGDAAHQSFAITLHRLRQLLGSDKVLQLRDGVLKIDPKTCWVDSHAFEEILVLAEKKSPDDSDHLMEKAFSLYQGPFLKGSEEPWAISCRERLRNRYLRSVQRLGERLENAGQFNRAVDLYRKGLETDILAEEMYRRLMRCLQSTGKNCEAMAVYERCRKVLRQVIGIEPSRETEAVYRALNKHLNKDKKELQD